MSQADATRRFYRMVVLAYETFSEDTGVPVSLERRQRVTVLGSKLSEAGAFVAPEILKVGKPKVDAFFKQEPKLAVYRHPMDDILRTAPHTLNDQG